MALSATGVAPVIAVLTRDLRSPPTPIGDPRVMTVSQ